MGILSWLFPSPDDRVRRARSFLEGGRPDEARMEVLELDHPEAAEILEVAERRLAEQNLEAAVSWAQAGDDERVAIHLELAERFDHGGLEEAFRGARRRLREIRSERSEAARRRKEEEQARLLASDPLGLTGGPSWLDHQVPSDLLDPDREEIEQRLALLVENYPEALREQVRGLGVGFARAVLELEDGRADQALQGLLSLPDDQPLVQWERARAAHALGDPAAAARAVRAFARHAQGHHPMGRLHSGVYLAQLLTEAGDPHAALRALREVRQASPQEGGGLFAQLLLLTGALEEAEATTRELIRDSPRSMPLYGLLARIRLAGDHRSEAMRALEAGLEATHCSPGQCGFRPPDLDANRLLAILYLEDKIEVERALELAETAMGLVQQPVWEDLYLRALVAQVRAEPGASEIAEQLIAQTPRDHPRRGAALALLG
ncbi:MAG TPA: tetratricopeptide repeat protein [Deltaproteobacteria bacterium]|nr:tetratricopeptide repeat protein [Deltaproteobacteria bacterium]